MTGLQRRLNLGHSSVAGGFAGGASIRGALEPAVADSNGLDKSGVPLVNGIAHAFEGGDRIGRNAALDCKAVRLPLIVDAGKVHGILQAHSEINDVYNHLEHRGDDDGSAGSAEHEEGLAILQDDGGSH